MWDKFGGLQICPSLVESTSKVSVYTNEMKWALQKNKKDHQICPSNATSLKLKQEQRGFKTLKNGKNGLDKKTKLLRCF